MTANTSTQTATRNTANNTVTTDVASVVDQFCNELAGCTFLGFRLSKQSITVRHPETGGVRTMQVPQELEIVDVSFTGNTTGTVFTVWGATVNSAANMHVLHVDFADEETQMLDGDIVLTIAPRGR